MVRAAASCLILPNLLNGYWAYLMLNGFVKLLVGGGKKKKGKKDATATAAAGIMEPSGLSDPPPPHRSRHSSTGSKPPDLTLGWCIKRLHVHRGRNALLMYADSVGRSSL